MKLWRNEIYPHRRPGEPHKTRAGGPLDQDDRWRGECHFCIDGDGNRIKGTIAWVTTAFIGNYTEWITNATYPLVKYYYADSTRIAMRSCTFGGTCLGFKFLLGDHLGSTSITTDSSGNNPITQSYYPWGEKRWSSGTIPTTFQYTGQRREKDLGPAGGEGLYYYGARWYDSYH